MIPPAPNPPKLDQPERPAYRPEQRGAGRPDVKHLPCDCPFFKKEVWAIVTKQADGTWRIVNCLDKHRPCFEHHCAFTVDGGEWPFGDVTVGRQQLKDKP